MITALPTSVSRQQLDPFILISSFITVTTGSKHVVNWVLKFKSSVIHGAVNENGVINDRGYTYQPFSRENFIDRLMKLIVGDDLVSVTSNVVVL